MGQVQFSSGEHHQLAPIVHRRRQSVSSVASVVLVGAGLALGFTGKMIGHSFLFYALVIIATGLALRVSLRRVAWFFPPCIAYVSLWFGFVASRGYADESSWTTTVDHWVPRLEARLFGQLPTITLQQHWHNPNSLQWYDYSLTVVYHSFFILPTVIAAIMIVRNLQAFWHYFWTIAFMETGALALHFALPTSPPWLADDSVIKITRFTGPAFGIGQMPAPGTPNSAFLGDSNPLAAMPSVHMGVTCALVVVALRYGRLWQRIVTIMYAISMAICLVYFGEHYVLDELVGTSLAVVGGVVASKIVTSEYRASLALSLRRRIQQRLPQSPVVTPGRIAQQADPAD